MNHKAIMNNAANCNYLNNIACNTPVHLQILTPTKTIRLKTCIIGVDPNMSIILAMRHEYHWLAARNYIREGQGAIIRLLDIDKPDATVMAFRSKIQKITSIVGNWLIIDYPMSLQQVALRKYSRIPIHSECVIIQEKSQSVLSRGFLHDISINGCAYIGELLKDCIIGEKYLLQVSLDQEDVNLAIPITVRNIQNAAIQPDAKQYGFSFDTNRQEAQEFVKKVILHNLSK